MPLAIIGIGCLFPKADSAEAFWANIKGGVDAVTDIPATHWQTQEHYDSDPAAPDMTYARRGAFLEPVDFHPLEFGINPNNIEATDTTQLLGLVVAQQALRDAGYATAKDSTDGKAFNRDRTSVILGVTGALELVIPLGARLGHPIWRKALRDAGVEKTVAEDVVQRIADSYVPWQENSFPGLLGNVAAGRIANRFDTGGTNCVVDAACASSLGALHLAALELYSGRSEIAITGGFDTFNNIFMYMCFSKTPALSPTGDCRPFSAAADGTILGEGLGVIVLKRLADAQRDGDHIRAVIRSIGSSSDGKGNAVYAPSPDGQIRCLLSAYRQADVTPQTIELIEAHGTGTKVGDVVEAKALNQVFGGTSEPGPWCALGSVKSMIGHTKAAAGIAGLIKAALALDHKVLPPTLKVDQPQEAAAGGGQSPLYVNTEKRPWLPRTEHPRRAGVSAFGFGGSNFHCVLEEAQSQKTAIDWNDSVLVLSFSGENRNALASQLTALDQAAHSWQQLRTEAARLAQKFQATGALRLVIVAPKDHGNVSKLLKNAVKMLHEHPKKSSWSTPDGIYFGSGQPGKLAVLFPGQGTQYVGMLRDLACQFPQMLNTLAAADTAFGPTLHGQRLSDRIFPIPAFSAAARTANEQALNQTQVAQPALGAVSLGAWQVLAHFGLQADAAAGHSFGELVALCAAGRIEAPTLHTLACQRGQAMAEAASKTTNDAGSMLAVSASVEEVQRLLQTEHLNLVLANKNAPNQVVLSGATGQIARAAEALQQAGLRCRHLAVSAAFHSPLVAAAQAPLAAALEKITLAPGQFPVYANTTAQVYPATAQAAATLLAAQLAQPVDFTGEITSMYEAGIRIFLEVGPAAKITGLVRSILNDRPHLALALDSSSGKRSGIYDLACTLAQLAAAGHHLNLTRWDATFAAHAALPESKKPTLTIRMSGANYVKPRPAAAPRIATNTGATAPATKPPEGPIRVPQTTTVSAPIPPQHLSVLTLPAGGGGLAQALQATQQSILTLQKMQEQTARLHQQYLQGQEQAQQTIHQLVQQQLQLWGAKPMDTSSMGATTVGAMPGEARGGGMGMMNGASSQITRPTPTTSPAPKVEVVPITTPKNPAQSVLLEVIAEKTGYPVEMLDLDMSLDTDLGIDSIKRVEILSALQTRLPEAPIVKPDDLGRLQTLRQIVAFLDQRTAPDTAPPLQTATAIPAVATVQPSDHQTQTVLLEVIADKTGYPVDMLELDMSLDTDLGIDSIKRVEILSALQTRLPSAPIVKPDDLGRLQTLRQIVAFLSPGTTASATASQALPTAVPAPATSMPEQTQAVLLEVIADKTGYPVEMLELDMSLDTDLGIDSIKRVEILSALQTRLPEAPIVKPDDLGRLQTLRQIVSFLQNGTAKLKPETPSPSALPASPATTNGNGHHVVAESLDRQILTVVPLNGHPPRLPLQLPKSAPVWVTEDGAGLAARICTALKARHLDAQIIALDAVPSPIHLAGLLILAPAQPTPSFIQQAFQLIQRVGPILRQAGRQGGAFLASASMLDGCFALNGHSPRSPLTGGLAGLVKTAAHEWPEVTCKSLDLSDDLHDPTQVATQIVTELLLKGPREVGISNSGLCEPRLVRKSLNGEVGKNSLSPGDVVVVSGGARGVTAAVSVAVAKTYGCKLLLLGRSPVPAPEPTWLAGLSGEAEIKKALVTHQPKNGLVTPKALEEQYRRITAYREIRSTLQLIEASGASVRYCALDVRDTAAVATAIAEARQTMGNIRGLIHGAGVLQDCLIEQKTPAQFAEVFSTKVDGFNALLQATADDDLKVIVAFSSSTGRFGRKGQIAYAAANEVLNKLAQHEAHQRPGCRVLSMNWGPWEGGMVTPQLRRIFESEGVGLIPLQAGADYLVREMSTPAGGPVEIVILGGVGRGGKNSAPTHDASQAPTVPSEPGKRPEPAFTLAFERSVSVDTHPVLRSHVIKGKAVLPTALIVEWLAHGALHEHPGLAFYGFDDLHICKGLKLEPAEILTVQVQVGQTEARTGLDYVPVELRCGSILHARMSVVLAAQLPSARSALALEDLGPMTTPALDPATTSTPQEIYSSNRLFHGPDLHGITAIDGWSADGIIGQAAAAPAPAAWMRQPLRSGWLADPLVLDASFQMMILWCFETRGLGSLPTGIRRYRQYKTAFPGTGAQIQISVARQSPHAAQAAIAFLDHSGEMFAGITGYECVLDATLEKSFAHNQLAT